MKQTYLEYLKESTDTVKSNEKKEKLILLCVTFGVWALAVIAFWLLKDSMGAAGYTLSVTWAILPVLFFSVSCILGVCPVPVRRLAGSHQTATGTGPLPGRSWDRASDPEKPAEGRICGRRISGNAPSQESTSVTGRFFLCHSFGEAWLRMENGQRFPMHWLFSLEWEQMTSGFSISMPKCSRTKSTAERIDR